MNTCKSCKHWDKSQTRGLYTKPDEAAGATCVSPKLMENWDEKFEPDTLVYSYTEGGSFWVGPDFGCVHHEPLP